MLLPLTLPVPDTETEPVPLPLLLAQGLALALPPQPPPPALALPQAVEEVQAVAVLQPLAEPGTPEGETLGLPEDCEEGLFSELPLFAALRLKAELPEALPVEQMLAL